MLDQALCAEAEPLRQEEASKKVLNDRLWVKLVEYIRLHPELQTSEIIAKSSTSRSAKAGAKDDWFKDDVYKFFEGKMPEAPEVEVAAEHLVEVHLVPRFCNDDFDDNCILGYSRHSWPSCTLDTMYDSVVG